jgi:hypothetical protein
MSQFVISTLKSFWRLRRDPRCREVTAEQTLQLPSERTRWLAEDESSTSQAEQLPPSVEPDPIVEYYILGNVSFTLPAAGGNSKQRSNKRRPDIITKSGPDDLICGVYPVTVDDSSSDDDDDLDDDEDNDSEHDDDENDMLDSMGANSDCRQQAPESGNVSVKQILYGFVGPVQNEQTVQLHQLIDDLFT